MTTTHTRRSASLTTVAAEFWRHPSPWMLLTALVGTAAARVAYGDWRGSELVAPVVLLALLPFAEWLIHVYVLHAKPRRLGPIRVDSQLARKHREHHADPRSIAEVFIPWQTLAVLMLLVPIPPLLLFPQAGLAITFLVAMSAIIFVYEWMHFLIHSDYKPRHSAYRSVHRHHRLHHFKNEHYWFTVTTAGTADRVLGTSPDAASVPTSKTATALHAT